LLFAEVVDKTMLSGPILRRLNEYHARCCQEQLMFASTRNISPYDTGKKGKEKEKEM
jgi:hypothetical protein